MASKTLNLPPAEKLPLAVRKNVRDEFENKKGDLEEQLSGILGVPWKTDINPSAIWPYHGDGYAKDYLGSCIKDYIENAIWKLKYLIQNNGTTTTTELNEIAYTHLLQLGEDYTHNFDYCGVVINEGALRIVFKPGALGTNVSCALDPLIDALNDAPHPDKKPLNVKARLNIEQKYVPEIEELTEKFKKMLNVGMFTLTPNFEDNFAVLANSEHACDDWQQNMGSFTKAYFEGAHYQMDYKKFGEDDMLQEGFNEEVGKHEIALRVVDKLEKGSGYSEIFIEEGVLIVQTTPENFGTNVSYVCEGILDLL